MKALYILIISIVPIVCDGQKKDDQSVPYLKTSGFKPGQEKNLMKVVCTRAEHEWGAYNLDTHTAVTDAMEVIDFPKLGNVYTVKSKSRNGFYRLLELSGDSMWQTDGFMDVNLVKGL